jgi:CubicO group peptidase (beta-lactamase class C family)
MNAYTYGLEKMFSVIGTPDIIWYSDDTCLTVGGWGINATIREYAKFGYLYLKHGEWDGYQVVPSDWVERSTRPIASTIRFYGLHWWVIDGFNGFEESGLPEGIFMAMGIHGQMLYVLPGSNMVIAKTANTIDPLSTDWEHMQFLSLVMDSMQ